MCWAITCFGGPKIAFIGLGLGYRLGSKCLNQFLKTKKTSLGDTTKNVTPSFYWTHQTLKKYRQHFKRNFIKTFQ